MRMVRDVIIIISIVIVGGMVWLTQGPLFKQNQQQLFKTNKPEKRDIKKVILAEGFLEAQGTSKIGPLITAKVKKIHVDEGQTVTKGQVLAELENDRGGDAECQQAEAQLEQAQAALEYVEANYKREKTLFKDGQLADDAFEKITQTYKSAKADVKFRKAAVEKERSLLEQTNVRAPHDGTIIAVGVEEGEAISPGASPPKVLFEIARDLKTMKATFYIDENKIGDVTVGTNAEITVDTYPYRQPWTGAIRSIGMSKATPQNNQQQQSGQTAPVTYKAEILINNNEGLLRPGMTAHAKAIIQDVKNVLAVPGFVFQLNSKVLEQAAQQLHYDFKPMPPEKKTELIKQQTKNPIKTLWILENKTFIEKAIEIGVTDNAYFQILSGITETDNIVADDMTASDEMKKIAKQFA